MKRSRWIYLLAILMAFSMFAAACAEDDGGGETPTENGDDPGDSDQTSEEACSDELGCVEVAEGDPLVLGTLLVTSGENSALGQDSQNGVVLATTLPSESSTREEPGAVNGFPVEFEHQDEGCSPEGGQAGAEALSGNDQVVAVIGTSCSSAALGVADTILGDAGIPLVSPSNTSPDLASPDQHHPFYFRTAHNDLIQGAAMAQFVSEELGAKTAATIHDGSTYADGLQGAFADAFESEYGGTITAQEAVQVGDKDMAPVLTTIAADPPDFLFFPVFVAEGGLLTAQARENPDLADTDLGGADGMFTEDWIKAAGEENAEGVYLSGPDLEFENAFYADEFIPAYEEEFGKPTSVFHAHAYDATNIVLDAVEEVSFVEDGTLFVPRTALRDTIADTEGYAGIVGELTCDDNGDCNPGASMSVSIVKNGDFEVFWRQADS